MVKPHSRKFKSSITYKVDVFDGIVSLYGVKKAFTVCIIL